MRDKILFLWRSGTQVILGALWAWLAVRGLNIDPAIKSAIEFVLLGAGIAVYASVVHFLETRTGDNILAKACRALARLLMLGAPSVLAYTKTQAGATSIREKTASVEVT